MITTTQAEPLRLRMPGFRYEDLYLPEKLAELSERFYAAVRSADPDLAAAFDAWRNGGDAGMAPEERSRLLVEMAPQLDAFVAQMFGVEKEMAAKRQAARREQLLFRFRKEFFIRRVLKKYSAEQAGGFDRPLLDRQMQALTATFPPDAGDAELRFAAGILDLWELERALRDGGSPDSDVRLQRLVDALRTEKAFAGLLPADHEGLQVFPGAVLDLAGQWLAAEYYDPAPERAAWISFRQAAKIDFERLVELEPVAADAWAGPARHYRRRDGFDLTDNRYGQREVMKEIDYCVFCHERDKDSCSKGFAENGGYKQNPLGNTLKGCPLDQKISESNLVGHSGNVIGALAIILIDNPLCPGTGHRICNDCMKSCIYQKQEPVNIPQIETRLLTDVLDIPWGFEIYSLLTRWNPLRVDLPHALPFNGKTILVVGMGPAGYTLAHYLLNEGFAVVGVDGLKIEPLPEPLVGKNGAGFQPLRDFSALRSRLSERVLLGFGGVSEYGITVRWDKNFLTVIYLNLMRRAHFRLFDGLRFGGTLTLDEAWELGFDHVCFATGAGKPTFVSMKNNLIRGIRKASDFLMALQLTGAGKRESMANLQVQLPALVIGGGLTAVDTATELMAYYPVQVTKVKERYDRLCARYGADAVRAAYHVEERATLDTFLGHAAAIEQERARAAAAGEQPDFIPLIRQWGGVHLYYRKSMNDSPAYRLNHEEIIKALEEGIVFVSNRSPLEAVPDEHGALREMVFERTELVDGKWKNTGEIHRVPARTLMVAAGTVPNVMYERENPGTFQLDGWDAFFQSHVLENGALRPAAKGETGFYTSYEKSGRFVSYYGDNHPVFEGNVVKAMASAKQGYRAVAALFPDAWRRGPASAAQQAAWTRLAGRLEEDYRAHVVRVERLTPTITEIVVHAPAQARRFRPGQFFRLQNYEVDAPRYDDTLLLLEGLALTGAWVDVEKGLLGMIILEVGASSRMAGLLKPGQRVVVMGPTGEPTEVPGGATVLLVGGGLGNAVLFSIAKAARERGSKVLYFAGYKKKEDFFRREAIEAATDVVVYSVDAGEPIEAVRPGDRSFTGNIVQAMEAYASGRLGPVSLPLRDATRMIVIGSDRMMAAVGAARHTVLKPWLDPGHEGIASINSPMQCMMKAICAQCLQRHVDPETGAERFVFSCVNQDQKIDHVDFDNLHARLQLNTVLEKLSNQWLDYLLERHPVERV